MTKRFVIRGHAPPPKKKKKEIKLSVGDTNIDAPSPKFALVMCICEYDMVIKRYYGLFLPSLRPVLLN